MFSYTTLKCKKDGLLSLNYNMKPFHLPPFVVLTLGWRKWIRCRMIHMPVHWRFNLAAMVKSLVLVVTMCCASLIPEAVQKVTRFQMMRLSEKVVNLKTFAYRFCNWDGAVAESWTFVVRYVFPFGTELGGYIRVQSRCFASWHPLPKLVINNFVQSIKLTIIFSIDFVILYSTVLCNCLQILMELKVQDSTEMALDCCAVKWTNRLPFTVFQMEEVIRNGCTVQPLDIQSDATLKSKVLVVSLEMKTSWSLALLMITTFTSGQLIRTRIIELTTDLFGYCVGIGISSVTSVTASTTAF